MSKPEIIGYEGSEPIPKPKNYHPQLDYKIRAEKTRGATHREFLKHWREDWGGQTKKLFSSLADSNVKSAYICSCGFEGIFPSEKCTRCGRILT